MPAKFSVVILAEAFFGSDGMRRKIFGKAGDDGLLAALVRLRDEVDVSFVLDFRRSCEFFAKDFSGFEGGVEGDFKIIFQIVRQMPLPGIRFESLSLTLASVWQSSLVFKECARPGVV